MLNSVLRPQTSLILSTSILFTPTQRAWFPYTWTLSSHSLLGDMRPLEFTIMIKPFSTGKGLSLRESAIDHSVFLSRGLIFSTLWVPMICCKPFIHPHQDKQREHRGTEEQRNRGTEDQRIRGKSRREQSRADKCCVWQKIYGTTKERVPSVIILPVDSQLWRVYIA